MNEVSYQLGPDSKSPPRSPKTKRDGFQLNLEQGVKWLIFIYFLLWIFEGALRKWFIPQLATPLLIVRDPVVLLIYFIRLYQGRFPNNGYIVACFLISSLGCFFALTFGHGNLFVAGFGVRTFLLHFPLVFVIRDVLSRKDLVTVSRWGMWLSVPMTLLLIVQYKSPASALVNIGPGGEGTSVFAGAMGKHRPPGTFSFISGTACLYPMVTAMWFSLYFLQKASLPLLALSGMAIFLACPVSISRFLVVGVVLVVLAGFVGLLRSGMVNPGRIIGGAAIFMLIIGLSTLHPEFREASEAFGSRWNNSTSERGGVQRALVGRVLDTVTKPLAKGFEIPIFGHGIGLGTQVGAIYASGARSFELGEEEFPRVMSELGPVLGLAMMILRFVLAWNIGVQCLRTSLAGQSIPLVFGAAAIPMILYGLWGQATQLGAFAITTGLVLAWLKQAGVRSC